MSSPTVPPPGDTAPPVDEKLRAAAEQSTTTVQMQFMDIECMSSTDKDTAELLCSVPVSFKHHDTCGFVVVVFYARRVGRCLFTRDVGADQHPPHDADVYAPPFALVLDDGTPAVSMTKWELVRPNDMRVYQFPLCTLAHDQNTYTQLVRGTVSSTLMLSRAIGELFDNSLRIGLMLRSNRDSTGRFVKKLVVMPDGHALLAEHDVDGNVTGTRLIRKYESPQMHPNRKHGCIVPHPDKSIDRLGMYLILPTQLSFQYTRGAVDDTGKPVCFNDNRTILVIIRLVPGPNRTWQVDHTTEMRVWRAGDVSIAVFEVLRNMFMTNTSLTSVITMIASGCAIDRAAMDERSDAYDRELKHAEHIQQLAATTVTSTAAAQAAAERWAAAVAAHAPTGVVARRQHELAAARDEVVLAEHAMKVMSIQGPNARPRGRRGGKARRAAAEASSAAAAAAAADTEAPAPEEAGWADDHPTDTSDVASPGVVVHGVDAPADEEEE
jgi:hypothetical protein